MDECQSPDKDVLEYYHSPLAAQVPFYQLARLTRNSSTRSTSSSDGSCLSDTKDSDASSQLSNATHHLSVPSVGNPGRRPIAIAQVEQITTISPVPPRAHPATPQPQDHQISSDVVSSHRADVPLLNPAATNPLSHNTCSTSESLPSSRVSSRDIGVDATVPGVKQQSPTQMPSQNNNSHSPPIPHQPETASVLPPSTPDLAPPLAPIRGLNVMKRDKSRQVPANASRLGDNKENHTPIGHLGLDTAPDHIGGGIRLVKPEQTQNPDFASASPLISTHPSSDPTRLYVNYQPGIHSTAGPLPPPPRLPGFDALATSSSSPPPPRPPRLNTPVLSRNASRPKDIEVVKQALQLPPSVSAALASRSQKVAITDNVSAPNDNVDSGPTATRLTSNSATPSSPCISESSSSSYCMLQHTSPMHRREGAFLSSCASTDAVSESRIESVRDPTETPSNTILKLEEVSSNGDASQGMTASELPPPSPVLESAAEPVDNNDVHSHQSIQSNRSIDHGEMTDKSGDGDGEDSYENWVSVSRELSPSCFDRSTPGTNINVDEKNNSAGINKESSDSASEAPSPPPKNFRTSLTTGLKRFSTRSLPRTPSVSSGSRRSPSVISKRFSNQSENQASFGSGGLDLPSPSIRSASLSPHPVNSDLHTSSAGVGVRGQRQARAVRRRVVRQWPSAMFCNEMHGRGNKLTSSEKCAIYRRKINELYMYDCGLSVWVGEMKFRGPSSNQHGNGASNKKFPDTRSPTESVFVPKPRQTSRSSMISEATFPTRPDASTATDLLLPSRDSNDGYLEDVPILPYPSLATAQRAAASNVPTHQTPPASIRSYGSNSTLPSVTVLSSNHTHTPVNSQSPGATPHHTPLSPPLNRSSTTSTGGGFFASLGRKASLSSSKKPTLGLGLNFKPSVSSSYSGIVSPSIMQRHATKSSLGSPGAGRSKPVSVGGIAMDPASPPSIVPGGPRALSNGGSIRLQRSKTYVPSKSPQFHSVGNSSSTTVNNVERRPSLWELQSKSSLKLASPASTSTTPTQSYSPYTPSLSSAPYHGHGGYTLIDQESIQPHYQSEPNGYVQPQEQQPSSVYDLEFVRQINKLAELLPNANRMVLTGYLRRAGQDVLAIGQYLEDEKNGTLKAY